MASVGLLSVATSFPSQHVREFPDEQLSVSAGKLFWSNLSTKLNVLKDHIKTKKYADGIKRRHAKEARERDIAQALYYQ